MPLLTRWNSLNDSVGFPSLFREMDSLFRGIDSPHPAEQARLFSPAADVIEKENAFEVEVDLPGAKPEEIEVKLEGDTLTVSVERKREKTQSENTYLRTERGFGLFARSFVLPQSVVGTTPEASYQHGVLSLTLPKREETKPKTVQVKVLGK